MDRIVVAHTPLAEGELLFKSMHGNEGLSQLFEFDVELVGESHSLDMKKLLGKPLTLEITTGQAAARFLNGQITRCRLVGRESATSRHYIYHLTVRPWLWYLTQTSDSKIFQGKSVPDVIKEVLSGYKFAVKTKLAGTYRNWEYCVQYQETDFAFVSRLMEHEGIYYWFEHSKGEHALIITDDVTQHEPFAGYETLPYYGPDRTSVPQEQYVNAWEVAEQITPGGFATVDYDFKKPGASLDAKRANPGAYDNSDLEVFEWMGGYTDPDHGEHYSRVRLESLQSRQEQVVGATNARGIAPGYLVTLRNHPRAAENREYLIASANYRIRAAGYSSSAGGASTFDIDFVVVPSSIPFRAARLTPQPYTHGPQTARVVGPQGQQIWTDQYGRVKVQFHWDRYGERNQNSSSWVRVSSPWAGSGFGGIQLPRVGDEVIVDFIGGHPDRPIVVGRVYNAGNMPPWELPGSATQSGFLSRSQDGTPGTANAFMFEDKPGVEEIWLHAERNLRTEVEADELHQVDGNRQTNIIGNDIGVITGNRSHTVTGFNNLTVTGTQNVDVTDKETLAMHNGRDMTVENGLVETVVSGGKTLHVQGGLTKTTLDDSAETVINGYHNLTVNESNSTHTITDGNAAFVVQSGVFTEIVQAGKIVTVHDGGYRETTESGDRVLDVNGGNYFSKVSKLYSLDAVDGISMTSATKFEAIAPSGFVANQKTKIYTPWKADTGLFRYNGHATKIDNLGLGLAITGAKTDVSVAKLDWFGWKNQIQGLRTEISSPYIAIGTMLADFRAFKVIF